jgi:hypothetical protein
VALFMWGTLSDKRMGLLFTIASAVILGSESRGTCDYILLSQIRDFPFHCLLQLAGLWWRYLTLPSHGEKDYMHCIFKFKCYSVCQRAWKQGN